MTRTSHCCCRWKNTTRKRGKAKKSAIFSQRTLERYRPIEKVEAASEALLVSLNETGEINWPRMQQLTGREPSALQDELGNLTYRNPEGGHWETADRYLSGNVRAKLAAAQVAAQIEPTYQRNFEALRAIQPIDLEPGEIEARLGSPWIPPSDVRDFLIELLGVPPGSIRVGLAESIATWTVEPDDNAKFVVSNTTTHGTSRFRASDLTEQALNGRTPTAYDEDSDGNRMVNQPETIAAREKQQQLKDRFREWIWENPDRATRLARDYNFRFNNIRLREFDGSHLTLPGMTRSSLRDNDLAAHQKNAVWRILEGGSPLLAHVVGAGKTWDNDRRRHGTAPIGACQKTHVCRTKPSGRSLGRGIPEVVPASELVCGGKGSFLDGQPPASNGSHCHRQLRCSDRVA